MPHSLALAGASRCGTFFWHKRDSGTDRGLATDPSNPEVTNRHCYVPLCDWQLRARRKPYPHQAPAPSEWTRRLERNPEAMNPEPLPGYVWLDVPGKVLHVPAADPEFRG